MKLNFRLLVALLVLFFLVSVFFLTQVYVSLTLSFVLAYLLDPVIGRLEKKKLHRNIAVPMVLAGFFICLVLLGVALIPPVFSQANQLKDKLPQFYQNLSMALAPLSERMLGFNAFQNVDKLLEIVGDPGALLAKPLGGFVQGFFTKTFKAISTVLGLLIIPLMAYYLLMVFPKLYTRFVSFVPKRHHKNVAEIRERLNAVLGGFLRGQLVVCTILSCYYTTAFTLMGLELSLVLGMMAGFFNVVPFLGIASVFVLTMLTALLHGASMALYITIIVVFAIGAALEGSVLTPKIVGQKVGLGPLTLMISLLVGSELLGLVGMLLAVPIAALGKVFFDYVVAHYKESEMFKKS